MIATLVLLPIFAGAVVVFMRCIELNEIARNSSSALLAVKTRMANVENTSFANAVATFHNTTFTQAGLTGMGVTYVSLANPDLLQVTTSFSWQEKNGRVIGEDKNLNGVLNVGEDANGNGVLDSPVTLRTLMYDS
jgi:hypothetical protein